MIIEENEILEDYLSGISLRKLEKKYHHSKSTIAKMLREKGVEIRTVKETSRKYFCNDNYFSNINTSEKAYWLGFMFADGYVTTRRGTQSLNFCITLSSVDIEHLYKFNKCLESTYEIKEYTGSGYNKNGKFCRLLITSERASQDLINLGCVQQKTCVLKPPKIDKYIFDFIRGYFDADGTVYYTNREKPVVGFCGTEEMLLWINKQLNINPTIRFYNGIYETRYNGITNFYKFFNLIYKDANIFLERKYEKFLEIINKIS